MRSSLSLLTLIAAAGAAPAPAPIATDTASCNNQMCRDVFIPVSVSLPRYVLTSDIADDWDVTSLVFNLTRRDVGSAQDPLPVAQNLTESKESTYNISATICGTSDKVLIATHGIIESKRYWNPDFPGSDKYNFVKAAIAEGYSVLIYDRLGVGNSSTVSSRDDAQFQIQTAVLNSIIDYTRKDLHASKVILVGHSYGSYLTVASASQRPVDGVVLTGFSGNLSFFGPFLAGASLRVASSLNPARWGNLDPGYIQPSGLYATTYVYFAAPHFDHKVAEWTHEVEAEPFAVGELPSLLRASIPYSDVKAPVLVLQGQYDLSACGGNCIGVVNNTKALFTNAKTLKYIDDLPAGHNLNFHYAALDAFRSLFEFLKQQDNQQ